MSFALWLAILAFAVLLTFFLVAWFDRRNRVRMVNPRDEDRELARKEPYFRREIVEAKVKSLFPNHDPGEILKLLNEGIPTVWGLERLQLDILKVSDGSLDQLHHYVDAAKRDFMSVVRLAEYPKGSRIDVLDMDKLPYDEHRRIIEDDERQYLNWLKKS